MRDSVELEWAGIPSVAIVHEAMAGSAAAMAEVSGMRGYGFVTVPYPHIPLAVWSDEEIEELARDLAPQLLARLTEGEPDA